MAKAKATPDETIKRGGTTAKSTPKASDVEKTQSFTAAFAGDAHASAQHFINNSKIEVVDVEETNAGDAGTMVTVTYK
jgi:hypothetical protein